MIKHKLDNVMNKISDISPNEHVGDIDGLLTGIDRAIYLDAIRNGCTSFEARSAVEWPSVERVYLYARPEYTLAMAIAEGKSPSAALEEWGEAVGVMMTNYRKSRRKSILFEVVSTMGLCGMEPAIDSTNIDLAFAALAVYQSVEIKATLDELAASSIPLEGWNQPPQLDLVEVTDLYRQFRKTSDGLGEENSWPIKKNGSFVPESG